MALTADQIGATQTAPPAWRETVGGCSGLLAGQLHLLSLGLGIFLSGSFPLLLPSSDQAPGHSMAFPA